MIDTKTVHLGSTLVDENLPPASGIVLGSATSFRASIAHGHHGCCGQDAEICDCECHHPELGIEVRHCTACCDTSPCGKHIKFGMLEMHIRNCPACKANAQENCK